MKKKLLTILPAVMLGAALFTGCGSTQETGVNEPVVQTEEVKAEQPQAAASEITGQQETENGEVTAADAEADSHESLEAKQAILVVSFGTSYNDSRELTIGAIENVIAEKFTDYEVRRAFTSQIIIDKLEERDGIETDNVGEALERAVADGVTTLVVQPTHLMNGYEYTDLADELSDYEDKFEQVVLAEPLLMSDADFDAVVNAITAHTADYDDGKTALCFMGHGTEADSNVVYAKLQEKLADYGYDNYYIGTVEAEPSLDDVVLALAENGEYTRVVLEPLMVVCGDHANNDMAGDEEDSWKSRFESEGYEVECILEGLGQNEDIQQIYLSHVQAAIDTLE